MNTPRMGGEPTLRVFAKGDDLPGPLLLGESSHAEPTNGLSALVREQFERITAVRIHHERGVPFGVVLQQRDLSFPPAELYERGLLEPQILDAQFRSRLFTEPADVLVLSIEADVTDCVWRNNADGYLCAPPASSSRNWSEAERDWFAERFTPVGLSDVAAFTANLRRLIQIAKSELNCHVVVFNASSVDPDDAVHNYCGVEDTIAARILRFSLALVELSELEGISVIDVDRIVGELGAGEHVTSPFRYSAVGNRAIGEEMRRVLEDIGFFEARPLVAQIGRKEN